MYISELSLADSVRREAKGKAVLFHGTSRGSLIARTDTLLVPDAGDAMVSFTRSADVAVYFGRLKKDFDDGFPTVFVLDRTALKARYRLEPHKDPLPDDWTGIGDEMEERIWMRDIQPVSSYLLSILCKIEGIVLCFPNRAVYLRTMGMTWHDGAA